MIFAKSGQFACSGALLVSLLALAWPVRGAEPPPGDTTEISAIAPATFDVARQAILGLESDDFTVRERASARLQDLTADKRLADFLADLFRQTLRGAERSFEVRAQLEALLKQLPAAVGGPPMRHAVGEIDRLVDQLNDDASTVRDSARRHLAEMLSDLNLVGPLWISLKKRLAAPNVNAESRRILETLAEQAREIWLLAEPGQVQLPPTPVEEMSRLLEALVAADDGAESLRRERVERDLYDLVARDDTRAALLPLVEARIARAADAATASHLKEIVDFAKPAMAAEVWNSGSCQIVQYLTIDLPQFNEGRPRPTHFDRIDETTAHCVSGNTLSPGDYPVRVAIPHPLTGQSTFYYLNSLPTPRRRLAYELLANRDGAQRLREISRRTLDHFIANKRILSEQELLMLTQFDGRSVSNFAGKYFETVPDQPLLSSNDLGGQVSVHAALCYVLLSTGTHEAIDGLERLARTGTAGKPTVDSPNHIVWIAALVIAQRDPWPEIDDWLAGLLDQATPLVTNLDPRPELGASAAALLLERYGESPPDFGLESTGEIARLPFAAYRFKTPTDCQQVQHWWRQRKARSPAQQGP